MTTSRARRSTTCSPRPGSSTTPTLLTAYYEFWEPHTLTDPEVRPTWEALRADGVRIGVLSNTIWPRAYHEAIFERDGVLDLSTATSTPARSRGPSRRLARSRPRWRRSVSTDPARCVYVGDRLFDDIWGAGNAGMRAVFVPHSAIPAEQVGHTEGAPDAVVQRLAELPDVVRGWL